MTKLKGYLASMVLIAATPALAGEVNGNGKSTPIRNGVASSICAFSGLNDDGEGPNSHVQSYGVFMAAFGPSGPGAPGFECRGNL